MSVISVERATRLLSDLVAMRTVNPMGRPYTSAEPVERPAVDYIADLFRPYPVEMRRLDPSPIHESLLITVEGRDRRPYTLLEAHVDTVPADDWLEIAFLPRLRDGQLFGLGACDDKGSLAAMILAVQECWKPALDHRCRLHCWRRATRSMPRPVSGNLPPWIIPLPAP